MNPGKKNNGHNSKNLCSLAIGTSGSDIILVAAPADALTGVITGAGGTDEVSFTSITARTLVLDVNRTGVERVVIGSGVAAAAVTTGNDKGVAASEPSGRSLGPPRYCDLTPFAPHPAVPRSRGRACPWHEALTVDSKAKLREVGPRFNALGVRIT